MTLLLTLAILLGCQRATTPKNASESSRELVPSEIQARLGTARTFNSDLRGTWVSVSLPELTGPKWSDASSNPPLSALDAIKAAQIKQHEIFPPAEKVKWFLIGAKLVPWDANNGYWYWEVSFDYRIAGALRIGSFDKLRLAVLMDGSVVEPKIKRRD